MKGLRVVLHIEVSLDGKVNGFEPNMGTYYRLAETFGPDCILSGSETMLAADMPDPVPDWCFDAAAQYPSCSRMVMAVVDSRGRIRNWHAIKKQPFWKTPVALVSESTPSEYLEYLESETVDFIVAGKTKVDLRQALERMAAKYSLGTVRVDSGGTLATLLLSLGLVDEVSVLMSPCIAGDLATSSFIMGTLDVKEPINIKLEHVERMDGDSVWLRYSIPK